MTGELTAGYGSVKEPPGGARHLAVIDLGSNTFRLVVFRYRPGGSFQLVDEVRETVRLSAGATEAGITREALDRARHATRLYAAFCRAAGIEEEERKAKTPKRHSQLTEKQRELLDKGSDSIRSAGVRKLIEKRDKLIERLRPQCVDAQDFEFEKELLEELGMTEEEFKQVDKSLGLSEQQWQELQKLNDVEDDTISG